MGPILALAFGWEPVWLWVVLGGIFFGAVHDMTSMFMSVREDGRSVARIAKDVLGPAGYLLNLVVLIFVLTIVNAIFLNLSVTALTSAYPLDALGLSADQNLIQTFMRDGATMGRIGGIATTSVFVITLFAPILGWLIRRGGLPTAMAYALAALVCLGSVVTGFMLPVTISAESWRWLMTIYVFIACALPVWFILQPRDFTNVQILYGGMGLLFVSIVIVGALHGGSIQVRLSISRRARPRSRAAIWPILFITVACGAISGFHSLVASGTTVKQIPRESDVRGIGYGAMVLESFLAVLVLVAVASMLPQAEYLRVVFPAGAASNPDPGLRARGRANGAHRPAVCAGRDRGRARDSHDRRFRRDYAWTVPIRLARYLLDEFWDYVFAGQPPAIVRHPAFNTAIAVGMMFAFAVSGTVRQMWPIFGAGNQLIGALALTTVSVWLVQRARQYLFALVPAIFMIATTVAALILLIRQHLTSGNFALGLAALTLLGLSMAVVAISAARFSQHVLRPGLREPT